MRVAEELIKDKNREPVSVSSSTTIKDAVALMARENVGCLLVSEGDSIVGIWTERDLARNIADQGFDISAAEIGSFMSQPLKFCEWNDSVYTLIDTFLGMRIRHLPVKKEGVFIGLISAGDVMKAAIRAKDHELAQANSTLSWNYYEEWKHK
jgi:CBS domain-containing protein